MTERTVRAKFLVDVNGAIANVVRMGKAIRDSSNEGLKFAKDNKASFDAVGNAAGAAGLTAAAGLGLAIKKFSDFDKQMSAVKAATHETTGNMNLLRAAAVQAGKDTAFSATEAAQGIENLAKAGVSTEAILGGGLKGALDLAAAGQIDVATASEVAATAMTQFNLAGSQVPHIADLLAAGAGKAQGEVGDLAMALKQSGLVASQFGISVEDTTGTLAAFASAGLLGSDAGTSFKTMLLALANPSKESAAAMKALGINVYDAQGAFIGVAPLAEQLKTQLSGLTEEQRNAAMAQIFGNDAIRAANVLYSNGAAGITDWVSKVDDAGYAAETARLKTDNLAGDVERLGGAFDTALIQQGSGANSVLRGIVQTADSAVSAFADLPPAVSGTATALAAVTAAGGLSAAAVLKGVGAAGELKAQWQALGRTGRGLTLSMGAVGIALTVAAGLYGVFAKRNEEAKQKADDLRSTLDQQSGAITKSTRAFVANDLATSGIGAKARDLGLNLSQVTDAALGNEGALKLLVTQLQAVQAAGTQVGNSYTGNNKTLSEQGLKAKQVQEALGGYNTALSQAKLQNDLASEGAKSNTTAQDTLKAAQEAAAASAQEEAQALGDLISKMLEMPGQVLSLRDAQRQFQESLDGVTASIKENGKSLDITTPKGRANQEALDGVARSANTVVETMLKNKAATPAVVAAYNQQRAGLIAAAQQFGLNRKAAEAYANKVLAIPKQTNTDIKANITDLESKLRTAKAQLKDPNLTKERRAQLTATIADLERKVRQAKAAIASVQGKTVTITVNAKINAANIRAKVDAQLERAGAVGRATGGPIPGSSPSPTADNVPIMATAGEYMHQVSAVKKYGTGFMGAVNSGKFPVALAKGYAAGGLVGGIDPFELFSGQFAAPGDPLSGLHISSLRIAAQQAAKVANSYRITAAAQQKQLANAKATQARLDAAYKAGASRLATLRATGASEAAIKRQQLSQIEMQKRLNAAKNVTKRETADVTAAEKRYQAAAAVSTARTEAYKNGLEKINDVKQQAIDYAEQVANQQLQGSGITDFGTADAPTVLAALKERTTGLGDFATTLEKLQAGGLSKDLLDQLRNKGPASAELASQILAGGSSLIGDFNKSELALQGQAARIGAGAALQQFSVTNLTTNIQIGNEVVRVVKQVLAANQAALKRSVSQKTGR